MIPINTTWLPAAKTALAALIVAVAWWAGHYEAQQEYSKKAAEQAAQYAAQIAKAEREYSTALKAAADEKQQWYDFAQAQSVKLAEAHRRIDKQTAHLKEQIPHVLQADETNGSRCYRGLGDDSLRLYRQAFGYTD